MAARSSLAGFPMSDAGVWRGGLEVSGTSVTGHFKDPMYDPVQEISMGYLFFFS